MTTERLAPDTLKRRYHMGFKHLPMKPLENSSELVVVDIAGLLGRSDLASVVPTIPAQQLYLALKNEGLEQSHEILPYLSHEQLTRVLDYDCWPKGQMDRESAYKWLKLYNNFGPTSLYARYKELDEEYQIGLLQGLIRVYDEEEIEHLDHEKRDQLFPFPGNQFFYDILSEDPKDIEFVTTLVQSCMAGKMEYAMSLLQHAAYDVPNEPTHQLSQFRRARLEEDGFISAEEASECFLPFNFSAFEKRWAQAGQKYNSEASASPTLEVQSGLSFLSQVRQAAVQDWDLETALNVHQGLVILANNLCAACDVDPSDQKSLTEIFGQAQDLISLGLEYAAQKSVVSAIGILSEEHPKVLFRTGVTVVHLVRQKILSQLETKHPEMAKQIEKYLNAGAFGSLQWYLDTECFSILGFELTESFKGLFNRFPVMAERSNDGSRIQFVGIDDLTKLNSLATSIGESLTSRDYHN